MIELTLVIELGGGILMEYWVEGVVMVVMMGLGLLLTVDAWRNGR